MNRQTSTTLALALALIAGAITATIGGCDLGDVVQVKTPPAIQSREGLPARMTLNEAELEYGKVHGALMADLAAWKGNIEQADAFAGALGQLGLAGLDSLGPTLAGVPVVGPALLGAIPLAGFFLGRAPLRKEKEASYNRGRRDALDTASRPPPAGGPTP